MKVRIFSLIAILILLTGLPAWSQDARGSILGKITDPSGAVLTGATVVVSNPAMGTKLTLTTDARSELADWVHAAALRPA